MWICKYGWKFLTEREKKLKNSGKYIENLKKEEKQQK